MKLSLSVNNWGNTNSISFKSKNHNAISANLKLKEALVADTFNGKSINAIPQKPTFGEAVEIFFGKKSRKSNQAKNNHKKVQAKKKSAPRSKKPYVRPEYEYKNMFDTKLKAAINPEFKAILASDKSVHNFRRAYTRTTSLSTYLKEQMVGYITPDNDHWFEKAMPYILKGTQAKDLNQKEFYGAAREFWGLMAQVDNYWKSDAYIGYLGSMKQTPAVKATIEAIEDLRQDDLAMSSRMVAFAGYPSKVKYVPELLEKGAYTGVQLDWDGDNRHRPSAEHILPHSVLGDELNVDPNYLVASAKANSDRGSLPLMLFLKGWNQNEYLEYQESASNLKVKR